jgi:Cu(I)/Ag(I) efflux system membrane fusion protein
MKHIKPIAFIIIALIAGFVLRGCFTSPASDAHLQTPSAQPEVWTCSMHPQFQLPEPGKCPICFMDLIPLEAGSDEGGEREISLSPHAAKRMEIETTQATRRFAESEVRMVGKVDYDETRVSYISSWVPGRIDRLFVDYTGIPVKKGEHLAELYSPQLLTAQEELLSALQTLKNLKGSQSSMLLDTARQTIDAAREKLRLWGFLPEQVAELEKRGTPSDHMTIYSPASGIVIHKNAQEGMYVQTGTRIYTIADLSKVWVQLDAYESDLSGLRYGGHVEFTVEAYPGQTFEGTISFIDPIINTATRTAKVRVIVDNETGKLKPGMFARAVARPKVAADGHVMNPELAGKWISPMHPEVIKDEPGPCDVCGMPLVTAESLGYVSEHSENAPLLIPVSAAMKTGKRAVVYVEIPNREKPTYEGREVELGVRLGDFYVVESGLEEGERVVTRGAFKLDAELQIRAKPSMMSMPSEQPTADSEQLSAQTHCPIMGGAINKDVYTDYNGMRIYFCCAGCDGEFRANPDKYIEKMRAEGIEPEKIPQPQTLCPVMGNPINKEVFTDYEGQRIYFCCAGCDGTFLENPDKYLKQMKAEGVAPEKVEHRHAH